MVNKWRLEELAELAEVIDSRHKTPKYSESGYPMVRVVDVNGGALRLKDTKRVSQEVYDDFSRGRDPEVGDLVITRVGTYGTVSYVNSDDKFCLGQNTAFIIPKINSRFLYYQLISPLVKNQIEQYVVGAVQKTISLKNIRGLLINLPSDKEQKAIAHILGTLDNKIELNRQMNETLEAMAQALFKSWFVDFDPVIDNALLKGKAIPEPLKERAELRQAQLDSDKANTNSEINELFPSEFEFTEELGWIPKGWSVGTLSEIAHHVRDNVKADDIKDNDIYVGLEHIDRKNIFLSNYGAGDDITSNKSAFKESDILFGKLRPYFHKVCIAPYQGVCSTDILVFRPKNNEFSGYLTLTLSTEKLVEYANMRSTGTRMPRANAKDILSYHIPIIPTQLAHKFNQITSDLFNKGLSHQDENETLAKLRDTLLPKLMSGELRIADAEKLVENI